MFTNFPVPSIYSHISETDLTALDGLSYTHFIIRRSSTKNIPLTNNLRNYFLKLLKVNELFYSNEQYHQELVSATLKASVFVRPTASDVWILYHTAIE